MKIPRLKIRKSTRSTLSGVAIAIASLYALASAYEEARDNLVRFFVSTVLLLLLILVFAATVVAVYHGVRYVGRRILGQDSTEAEDTKE
jgi:nitrogen fixation/metabolism regulation signal transduction histidine kinase